MIMTYLLNRFFLYCSNITYIYAVCSLESNIFSAYKSYDNNGFEG